MSRPNPLAVLKDHFEKPPTADDERDEILAAEGFEKARFNPNPTSFRDVGAIGEWVTLGYAHGKVREAFNAGARYERERTQALVDAAVKYAEKPWLDEIKEWYERMGPYLHDVRGDGSCGYNGPPEASCLGCGLRALLEKGE